MSFLDDLTKNQKEKVISLPYRVGLWISQSDDTGGDDADDQEIQTLENIVDGFARDVFGSEVAQYIMTETVLQKQRWPEWAGHVDDVISDCPLVVDILQTHCDEKDIHAFQNHLMEIGEAVAMSFNEFEHLSAPAQFMRKVSYYIEQFKARADHQKKPRSMQEFLSISKKEKEALDALADALGFSY